MKPIVAIVAQGDACAGAYFVDAGIIGLPPRDGAPEPRLYAAGSAADRFAILNDYGGANASGKTALLQPLAFLASCSFARATLSIDSNGRFRFSTGFYQREIVPKEGIPPARIACRA